MDTVTFIRLLRSEAQSAQGCVPEWTEKIVPIVAARPDFDALVEWLKESQSKQISYGRAQQSVEARVRIVIRRAQRKRDAEQRLERQKANPNFGRF